MTLLIGPPQAGDDEIRAILEPLVAKYGPRRIEGIAWELYQYAQASQHANYQNAIAVGQFSQLGYGGNNEAAADYLLKQSGG